ncbi:hypothetical protein GCM10027059_24390 [Myceligenerans halotolerans]
MRGGGRSGRQAADHAIAATTPFVGGGNVSITRNGVVAHNGMVGRVKALVWVGIGREGQRQGPEAGSAGEVEALQADRGQMLRSRSSRRIGSPVSKEVLPA